MTFDLPFVWQMWNGRYSARNGQNPEARRKCNIQRWCGYFGESEEDYRWIELGQSDCGPWRWTIREREASVCSQIVLDLWSKREQHFLALVFFSVFFCFLLLINCIFCDFIYLILSLMQINSSIQASFRIYSKPDSSGWANLWLIIYRKSISLFFSSFLNHPKWPCTCVVDLPIVMDCPVW